jgi:hypothetical protein
LKITATANIGVKGRYKITSRVPDGNGGLRVHRIWEFPNLITDNGLNGIGVNGNSWYTVIALGTGTAAPDVSDTTLSGTVVSVSSAGTYTEGVETSVSPRYYWGNWSKTFAQGAAAGTWTEIGIGRSSSDLWSRARILDSGGSPSSITILAIEVLTVEYRLEMYQKETDTTGTVSLGGVTYDWTTRAYGVGIRPLIFIGGTWMSVPNVNPIFSATMYSGALNSNYAAPSGNINSSGGVSSSGDYSVATYVSNSFTKQMSYFWSTAHGNVSGGIGSLWVMAAADSICGKIGFVPNIPKDNTRTMSLVFKWVWARL